MSTISEISNATAGAASQIAIATTAPSFSGGFTVGSFVAAATTDADGFLRVTGWNIGEPSSGLVLNGDATWTKSTKNVAITGLDGGRVVTAHVDNTGTLNVGVWVIGAIEFPGGGGPPANPIVWLQYGTTGLSATEAAIATLSSTEVVTAVRDSSGNLRIDAWSITSGIAPPGDSVGILNPTGSLVAGAASDVAIAAGSPDQAVAAFRHANVNNNGKLGLIVFQISGGKVTRQGSIDAGDVSHVSISGGGPEGSSVSTATINDKGALDFTLWTVSSTGAISKLDGATLSAAFSDAALCAAKAGSDTPAIAAVLGGSGKLEMKVWDKEGFGGIYAVSTSIPATAVSTATLGYDNVGHGYFVTATRGSKPDNLGVQAWSVVATAQAPSQGLGSLTNYVLTHDNDCKALRDVKVTIDVHEALVAASTKSPPPPPGGSSRPLGFAFQLNVNSPTPGPKTNPNQFVVWQQYIIGNESTIGTGINNWTAPGLNPPKGVSPWFFNGPGKTLQPLPVEGSVPAGSKLTITLENDPSNSNVTDVIFTAEIPGQPLQTQKYNLVTELVRTDNKQQITAENLAPVAAFQLNLVGPGDLEITQFSSGSGTITYEASIPLTAVSAIPSCAVSIGTGEKSNSVYGILPANPSTRLVQTFGISK
jgi:hypothetical protein